MLGLNNNLDPRKKALLFSYSENFLNTYEGYVPDRDKKLYFYIEGKQGRFAKIRQIEDAPGIVRARGVWFFWDGTDEQKHELAIQAIQVLIKYYDDKREEAIKVIDAANYNHDRLALILQEIKKEGKDE